MNNEILLIAKDYYLEAKTIIFKWASDCWITEYLKTLDIIDLLCVYTIGFILISFLFNLIRLPSKNYNQSYIQFIKANIFLILVKYVPGVNSYLEKKKDEALHEFSEDLNKTAQKKTFKLPENGMTQERLQERLQEWTGRDRAMQTTGKISGTLYIPNDMKFESGVQEFTKNFIYSNPMHFDLFPAVRQMEAEVIKMTGDLFGQEKESIGILTSGGSESILLGMLAHRNWAKDTKGIDKPNIVIPETAHAAFYKAGEYFNIEVRIAKINQKTFKVNVGDLKSKIDSNTICIVGSIPNYPYGTMDPIEQLAYIAKKKKIGLHVDGCLGGFIIAFAKENGYDLGKFEFSLDGVTSLSVDQHKYGLAPKGVSTVLFKTKNLRQYAFFGISSWSGGAYVSPSMAGSKTGVACAGAWYVMQSLGKKKYLENSKQLMQSTQKLIELINEIPELQVFGEPAICVVAFRSVDDRVPIYSLQGILSKNGWVVSSVQKPAGIHVSLTFQNIHMFKQLIADIKQGIAEIKADPNKYKNNFSAQLYGTTQSIPDGAFADGLIKSFLNLVLKI